MSTCITFCPRAKCPLLGFMWEMSDADFIGDKPRITGMWTSCISEYSRKFSFPYRFYIDSLILFVFWASWELRITLLFKGSHLFEALLLYFLESALFLNIALPYILHRILVMQGVCLSGSLFLKYFGMKWLDIFYFTNALLTCSHILFLILLSFP